MIIITRRSEGWPSRGLVLFVFRSMARKVRQRTFCQHRLGCARLVLFKFGSGHLHVHGRHLWFCSGKCGACLSVRVSIRHSRRCLSVRPSVRAAIRWEWAESGQGVHSCVCRLARGVFPPPLQLAGGEQTSTPGTPTKFACSSLSQCISFRFPYSIIHIHPHIVNEFHPNRLKYIYIDIN